MAAVPDDAWPALPLDPWRDTYATLHMWTQIVGKLCLAMTPLVNHHWNVAFHVTARGWVTPVLISGDREITITFDFIAHELVIHCTDGVTKKIALEPRSVADFHATLMQALHRMGVDVHIWTVPTEVENPIRFEEDTVHRSYDAEWASAHWRALLAMQPVFAKFRSRFVGKSSPVHFFWGSFDLAVTRFNGKRATLPPDADSITREAYSHEVISAGFWPGGRGVEFPAFYAYAAPEPEGFKETRMRPAAAFYSNDLSIFILPYEAVRTAASPEAELTAFLESTYDAAANLAGWNRAELERPVVPT
jgi:hypothetical protein